MLAISTTWNFNPNLDIRGLLSQIKEVGFDAIEIGYSLSSKKLEELISLVDGMGIKVVSMHNFCPLPCESGLKRFVTDYYRLSSPNEAERKKAVEYTKRTIDAACLASCGVVVIHAGTVELKKDYLGALFQLYNKGKFGSKEYLRAKDKLLAVRRAKVKVYLALVVRSLEEVVSYAYSAGVKIGLETRYYPNEIPDIEEIEYLLRLFSDKGLVYWHDIGHAEVSERLGIAPHKDYLMRFADRMLGMHFHDLIGIDDHMAPFSGDLDFSKIAPYLREGLIKVIEAHPPATPQQIREAVKRLLP